MAEEAVVLFGIKETRKLLKDAAPDLMKAVDKEIRAILQEEVKMAKAEIPTQPPMSGWSATRGRTSGDGEWPEWKGGEISRSIKMKKGKKQYRKHHTFRYQSQLIMLVNGSASGSIFELAGRKSSGSSPAGRQFIANLMRFGQPSRVIWKVMDNGGADKVQRGMAAAYRRAEDQLQARLDAQGMGASSKTSAAFYEQNGKIGTPMIEDVKLY